ncbi:MULTISPECIES: NosD domain-containing protein [unclassified Methanosarcina]|uniref:NosD domain-containing protein n=1 Tax=unclassified Methanosarcina TaxID=2644672 RepID=UPI000615FDF1|nr:MULTISPECIES: NosD domain-containing protein [unclassified Methanosarcina]AKB18708.1 Cell surface protein [Methanosarcina sp. WWM596]AKB21757.1 Cell surface protein [Methanosarcina sp. WH1]
MDSANPGDVILVAPGTYTENIIINKNDLVIKSEYGNPANTIIAASNSGANVITIQNRNNVTIKGFKITGAGNDNSGIYLTGSTYCTIEDNILHNDALGVYLKTSHNNIIRNNTASKDLNVGTGRGINIEQSDYTNVLSNTVSNQRYGIYVSGSKDNILSGNAVSQSADHGIVLENTIDSTLENNVANSNQDYGIYLSSSESNILRSNTVFNNTNGINLVSSSGNTISDNTVSDDALVSLTHGIFMNTSHNNNLQSNTVSNVDYGIAMRYSNNNSLVNNDAHNNNRGIYLTLTSSINTLSGNLANSNLMNGIVLDKAGNNNLINNIARLNSADGIVLGNSNNNNLTNNNASENNRGIHLLTVSSGNTLSGNIVNSNTGHGILLENVGNNNNLSGNTAASNSIYGIYLVNSSNNYLLSNIAPRNSKGIYIMNSSGNTISNNTLSDNIDDGIMLSLSNSNTLSGNRASNNNFGISLDSSGSNSISSNIITSSRNFGIFMCSRSSNNQVVNNYFSNTANTNVRNTSNVWNTDKTEGKSIAGGPYLGGNFWGKPDGQGHSQLNNDTDGDGITEVIFTTTNVIDYLPLVAVAAPVRPDANFSTNVSSGYAPLTVQFTDLSENSTSVSWDFDNNGVIDSTVNNPVYEFTVPGIYTVNLTASNPNGTDSKTSDINVLEEGEEENETKILPVADFTVNKTSGYYPLTVLFTDTSQNATSRSWDVNNDGIEDSNETSFVYVYPSAGTYTAKLTVINANDTDTKTIQIAVNRKSSGGSRSGGGGGGGSPESSRNIEVKELSQVFITNGKAVQFDFTKKATCVVYVSFDSKKTVGKTTTIVEQLKNKSTLVSELPSDEVYKFFNIWVGNSGFATSKNIENPVIGFKVEKAWAQDEKIDQASITLNRFSNKTWEQLPVSLSDEDEEYLYFTAETPGFSSFAITGKADNSQEETATEIQPGDEFDNSEENTEDTGSEADQESEQGESTGMPGFELVYGVAGLLAVLLYKRK